MWANYINEIVSLNVLVWLTDSLWFLDHIILYSNFCKCDFFCSDLSCHKGLNLSVYCVYTINVNLFELFFAFDLPIINFDLLTKIQKEFKIVLTDLVALIQLRNKFTLTVSIEYCSNCATYGFKLFLSCLANEYWSRNNLNILAWVSAVMFIDIVCNVKYFFNYYAANWSDCVFCCVIVVAQSS